MKKTKVLALMCALAMAITAVMPGVSPKVHAATIEEENSMYGEIQLSNVTDDSAYLNATNIVDAIKKTDCVPRTIRWYVKAGSGSNVLTASLPIEEESSLSYRMTGLIPGTVYEPFVMITYFDTEKGVQHIYKSYSSFTTTGNVPTPIPTVTATTQPTATTEPTATPTVAPSTKPAIISLKRPNVSSFEIVDNVAACTVSTKYKEDVSFEYRMGFKNGQFSIFGKSNGDILTKVDVRTMLCVQVRATCMSNGKQIYSKWSKKRWAISQPKASSVSIKMKGKKGHKKLRITWDRVNNAKGYRVYYRSAGAKKWKTLATTKKCTVYSKKLAKKSKVQIVIAARGKIGKSTVTSTRVGYVEYRRKK